MGLLSLCEQRDSSGATTTARYFSQGEQQGADSFFYTRDHLGSIRELADTTGNIRARYDYDPYGRTTKLSGDRDAAFSYTGHYAHAPSGLLLTHYRAYDPNLARWLSEDPLGLAGGVNLYDYVLNQPENGLDPEGLDGYDSAANFVVGAGDGLTLGLTKWIRHRRGLEGTINECSGSYGIGFVTGVTLLSVTATGIAGRLIGGAAGTLAGASGPRFIVPPNGPPIEVPPGYETVIARNGDGIVLRPQGQSLENNSNIVRYGDPDLRNPEGYIRYYNKNGQPLNPATGPPGSNPQTHIPPSYQGPLKGYPGR